MALTPKKLFQVLDGAQSFLIELSGWFCGRVFQLVFLRGKT